MALLNRLRWTSSFAVVKGAVTGGLLSPTLERATLTARCVDAEFLCHATRKPSEHNLLGHKHSPVESFT